jgi:hypothetical protein
VSSLVERRLADLALGVWAGELPSVEWLKGTGWTEIEATGEGQITATGPSGIRTAIVPGTDPACALVGLAFGFFGTLWPRLCPNALDEVSTRWRDETRRRRFKRTQERRTETYKDHRKPRCFCGTAGTES